MLVQIAGAEQTGSRLMSDQRIGVRSDPARDGCEVKLIIGNAEIGFDYETALQISQWLRVKAKQAKRRAGDDSRKWRALAILDGG